MAFFGQIASIEFLNKGIMKKRNEKEIHIVNFIQKIMDFFFLFFFTKLNVSFSLCKMSPYLELF